MAHSSNLMSCYPQALREANINPGGSEARAGLQNLTNTYQAYGMNHGHGGASAVQGMMMQGGLPSHTNNNTSQSGAHAAFAPAYDTSGPTPNVYASVENAHMPTHASMPAQTNAPHVVSLGASSEQHYHHRHHHAQQQQQQQPPPPPPPNATTPHAAMTTSHSGAYVRAFDDTSGQPLLADSSILEELRRNGHVIVDLMDAYRSKLSAMQNKINGSLMAKRDRILRQLARVQAKKDEVTYHRQATERARTAALQEHVESLRSAERLKLLLLARDHEELSRDVDHIQRFIAEVASCSSTNDPVHFLTQFRALDDACERLCAKPFKEGEIAVDVKADGGASIAPPNLSTNAPASSAQQPQPPMDAAEELKDLQQRHAALKRLLAAKDEMIWHLLDERKGRDAVTDALLDEANGRLDGMHRTCVDLYAAATELKAKVTGVVGEVPAMPEAPKHIKRPPPAAPPPALAALLADAGKGA